MVKAWIAEAEVGSLGASLKAVEALEALSDHYLDKPCVGGWTDQFDQNGHALTVYVPPSTFYHAFCAVVEANRVLANSENP